MDRRVTACRPHVRLGNDRDRRRAHCARPSFRHEATVRVHALARLSHADLGDDGRGSRGHVPPLVIRADSRLRSRRGCRGGGNRQRGARRCGARMFASSVARSPRSRRRRDPDSLPSIRPTVSAWAIETSCAISTRASGTLPASAARLDPHNALRRREARAPGWAPLRDARANAEWRDSGAGASINDPGVRSTNRPT